MLNKISFVTLVYLPILFPTYSQVDSINKSKINLIDSNGQKIGLWIENDGLIEVYYKDDERNGIFKSYYRKNGKLEAFGEYTNGKRAGIWYYFNEIGQYYMIECDISDNNELQIRRDDGENITPKFKSFISLYYPNGALKEEGIALYNEDIEIDFFKYGTWKYYDTYGELLKTENH
jgi:antitoxin component YwqK of YwqJK toxin-antitoxin module